MPAFESKLPDVGTTIFTVMSQMAAEHGALNLSQGFPDFPVAEELIALIHDAMKSGNNQYAPMAGLPELRESISRMTGERYGYTPDPDREITVTAGATEALFASIMALVSTGDEVIIFDPAYDSYAPAIRMAGGIPVHLKLKHPTYLPDWEEVHHAITNRTKLILINSPHNPSGSVLSKDDVLVLERLVSIHDIFILSDEVYEHIIFDGKQHESVLKYPDLRKKSVAVSSFGKTFHATGWKVGYLIAPDTLATEIRKVHQFITFSVHTPTQVGLAQFLQDSKNYSKLSALYERKRAHFLDRVAGSSFEPIPSSGTYFQLLNYSTISDKTDIEMAEYLTRIHGLASIPISVFYEDGTDHKVLRFCFAKEDETLSRAAEILCEI